LDDTLKRWPTRLSCLYQFEEWRREWDSNPPENVKQRT
jgi:hypothetical protein